MPQNFDIRQADWTRDEASLYRLRELVFVVEQGVPADLEWDGLDRGCRHFIAETGVGAPIGTTRVTDAWQIGRMAVLPEWRRRGVGTALLGAAIAECRMRGADSICLHAQVPALGFYRRMGFVEFGPIYEEANIAHQSMRMSFGKPATGI